LKHWWLALALVLPLRPDVSSTQLASGGVAQILGGNNTYSGNNTLAGTNTISGTTTTSGTQIITGVLRETSTRCRLASNYTNATAGFTPTTCSITVTNGQIYNFKAIVFLQDSTAADGAQINFNGGSAAATDFRVHCILDDTTTTITNSAQATALATAFSIASLTGLAQWACNGTFEPSSTGTFILQGAQNAHTTGTLTLFRGSQMWFENMP
jgi:hypothetical protein